ncbi:M10 family metallopeptidase C-terminal domain-containing protein [Sphingomonas phyllosphaerae]|uniref:M10 family metallopeptidase C-terminal domain-containing protein n=1 Tax=Sphingomonas phyllosphaerae TaxID=257003 RepID=UPI0003B680A3|nr:M10 family metallopeptidase C-terminal domain-containing protein [Sphingomonas phyllosphaerae]
MVTASIKPSYEQALSNGYAGMACGCSGCAGAAPGTLASLALAAADGTHGDVRGAELLRQTANGDGSYSFSGERNIDAVLIGSRWTGSSLTFTFPETGNYGPAGFAAEQMPFNEAQKAAARAAFDLVEGYTGLTITEVAPDTAQEPTFRLSQTMSRDVPSAQGGFPGYLGGEGGQIWFGRTEQPYYENPAKGNWGNATMMHEIGHTLGLKHGMDDYSTENMASFLLDGTGVLYGTRAIEYDKDGQAWSLMTYTPAPNGVPGFEGEGANQPQSYMQLDIAALQYLYGANFNTNAGNTVYRWDAATGEKSINGVGQGAPTGNKVFETIWDGGGVDTYDFSNYGGGVVVDLRPGAFSTPSGEQLVNSNAASGGDLPAAGSVGNALLYKGDVRSLIENAIGGAGDDRITGNQADNVLIGLGGDDVLAGGAGSDTLVGGAGNDVADFAGSTAGIMVALNGGARDIRVANGVDVDTLSGIEGIVGTAFDDRLTGDAGDNMLSGGAGGRDVLIGGAGNDTLVGGGYTLAYADRPDVVRDAAGTNKSQATAIDLRGAFDLVPRATQSTAVDFPGVVLPHATVVAAASGQAGNDWYRIDAIAGSRALFDIDATNNFSGIEIVDAAGRVIAANYREATSDDGSRRGTDARLAHTFAESGAYYIRITGSSFDAAPQPLGAGQFYTLHVALENAPIATPVLRSTGSGTFDGGTGDDTIVASAGDDVIDGGAGTDTLSYRNHYQGVTVALGVGGAQATGAGRDTIAGIENLTGSIHADRLTGDTGDNVIDGGGGSDVVAGGAGTDTLSFASQASGVAVTLGLQGTRQGYRAGQTVEASGFENLTGTAFADTLTGDGNANVLRGGAGDDMLAGGLPARVGVVDILDGGTGSDTASFAAFTRDVRAVLGASGRPGEAALDGTRIAILSDIENLAGGRGNDALWGNDQANRLAGDAGNDTLDGGAGDDTLDGGAGDDLLRGGAGIDTAIYADAVAATVDLSLTGAQDTGYGRDTLSGIENVRGGRGNDVFAGDGASNTFFDAGGDDRYDGRAGSDTVDYSDARQRVIVDLGRSGAQATGGGGNDTLVAIENVRGGAGGNYLTGSAGDNVLTGNAAADLLIGGAGRDTLSGGDGDDLLTGDGFALAPGADAADMRDVLIGGAGRDTLIGGAGDDELSGGDDDDFLSNGTFSTEVFADTWSRGRLLKADGGNDVIDGGKGSDFAVLAYFGRTDAIRVDIRNADATNIIYSGGVAAGSITSVEKLGFEGGNGDDVVYAGAGYDFLGGRGGNDVIDAGAGNDVVYYDAGNDVLSGGEGYDAISFQNATQGVVIDLTLTGAQATALGVVTIDGFEAAVASAFGDTLYLTDRRDELTDEGTGDDRFYGRGGDDYFSITRTTGAASSVLLDGGAGDDRLQFQAGRYVDGVLQMVDSITVNGGAGRDFISINGAAQAIVDAGADDDFVVVGLTGGSDRTGFALTLGAGRDVVSLYVDDMSTTTQRTGTIVTDFSVRDGDRLDLTYLVTGYTNPDGSTTPTTLNYNLGEDPFATGTLRVIQSGDDTLVQADRDGVLGAGFGFVTVLTLKDVATASLTAANFSIAPFELGLDVPADPSLSSVPATLGSDGADTLNGTAGRNRILGLGGDDRLFGFAGNDVLIGAAGNDVLDGGTGADMMIGGTGDDLYRIDNVGDRVFEADSGGTDTVETAVGWTMGIGIENVRVLNDARVTIVGNYLNNVMRAGAGSVIFDGGLGNDTLTGGAARDNLSGGGGDDRIDGGAGMDVMTGGAGDDLYVVDANGDLVVEAANGGTDTVRSGTDYTLTANVENLYLIGAARTGTGNTLDNGLYGTAGNDTLSGLAGNDVLKGWAGDDRLFGGAGGDTLYGAEGNDRLDGGAGADRMQGDGGDDIYFVDDGGDQVIEFWQNGQGGIDSVYASVNWTLGAHLENLYMTGSAAVNGAGNALDNVVRGSAGDNVLRGGGGNDTIVGQGGSDMLWGDAGADTFVFGTGSGRDTIADFGSGDTIDLSGYRFDGAPTVTDLGADTLIDLGDGNAILMVGIDPGQLTFTGNAFGFAG